MAPRSTPFSSVDPSLYAETFQVKVGGDDGKVYMLHKGITSFLSGYFEMALKKDTFKEGRESYIELPEEEIDVFDLFVSWLYGGQALHAKAINRATFELIVELYAFADRREIPLLENCIINGIAQAEDDGRLDCVFDEFNVVCKHTPEGCGLRHLLMNIIVSVSPPDAVEEWRSRITKNELSREGLWDLAVELAHVAATGPPDLCRYHAHYDGRLCPSSPLFNDVEFINDIAST